MAFSKGARAKDSAAPEREGDVLGISNANPDVKFPTRKGSGGGVRGIDVRTPTSGLGDVPQRAGATGIDMGRGGEGTDVEPRPTRTAESGRRTARHPDVDE